jgi:hypothetical protein
MVLARPRATPAPPGGACEVIGRSVRLSGSRDRRGARAAREWGELNNGRTATISIPRTPGGPSPRRPSSPSPSPPSSPSRRWPAAAAQAVPPRARPRRRVCHTRARRSPSATSSSRRDADGPPRSSHRGDERRQRSAYRDRRRRPQLRFRDGAVRGIGNVHRRAHGALPVSLHRPRLHEGRSGRSKPMTRASMRATTRRQPRSTLNVSTREL